MNRRAFLASIGSTAAVGLAGCAGSPGCDDLGDNATHAAYASRETIFVQLSDGLLGDTRPSNVSEDKLEQIRYALKLGQEIVPIEESDQYDPDGYGPYEGFFVRGNLDKDTVSNTFDNRGVKVENEWWSYRPTSWSNFGDRIVKRAEAAREFTASKDGVVTVPDFGIRETGRNDDGERAQWVLYESDSDVTLPELPTGFGLPSGLAVEPASGGSPASYKIVEPASWVADADVLGAKSSEGYANYEVQLTIQNDAVDAYIDQLDESPDRLLLHAANGHQLQLPVSDSDTSTATMTASSWAEAYGVATSFVNVSAYPVYTNGDVTSCTE